MTVYLVVSLPKIPGVINSSEQILPLGAKLKNCQLRRPYSGHISEVPLFGASDDPLCKNTVYTRIHLIYMVLANHTYEW